MKRLAILMMTSYFITGCINNNLCGVKGQLIEHKKLTNGHPTKQLQLKKDCIDFLTEKSENGIEEKNSTIPLLYSGNQVIKTEVDGYGYYVKANHLNGLLAEGEGKTQFDQDGKETHYDITFTTASGLLSSYRVYRTTGNKKWYYCTEKSILSGFLYSSRLTSDSKGNETEEINYILKAFGYSQKANGSSYISIFWTPIKVSN